MVPAGTQALARVFDAAAASPHAQVALSRIGGREGYRPFSIALGAAKPILLYPDLRGFVQQSIRVLGPGGPARAEFEHLLKVTHEEMTASRPSLPLSPLLVSDPSGIAQPNRPRDNVELLQYVLLSPDASYALPNTPPAPIVQRDPRGFALVAGSRPGEPGSVPPPFSDLFQDGPDGPVAGPDGMADVDAFGRFIDAKGNPVLVDVPFDTPGKARVRQGDALGRALLEDGSNAYEYLDTQQTLVASLARDLRSLADPNDQRDFRRM